MNGFIVAVFVAIGLATAQAQQMPGMGGFMPGAGIGNLLSGLGGMGAMGGMGGMGGMGAMGAMGAMGGMGGMGSMGGMGGMGAMALLGGGDINPMMIPFLTGMGGMGGGMGGGMMSNPFLLMSLMN